MAALVIALLLVFAGALLGTALPRPDVAPCGSSRAASFAFTDRLQHIRRRASPAYPRFADPLSSLSLR